MWLLATIFLKSDLSWGLIYKILQFIQYIFYEYAIKIKYDHNMIEIIKHTIYVRLQIWNQNLKIEFVSYFKVTMIAKKKKIIK